MIYLYKIYLIKEVITIKYQKVISTALIVSTLLTSSASLTYASSEDVDLESKDLKGYGVLTTYENDIPKEIKIIDSNGNEINKNKIQSRASVNPGSFNWKYKTTKYTKDYGSVSVNSLSQFLFAAATGWGLGKLFTKAVSNSVAGGIFSFVKAPSIPVVYYKVAQYTATDHTKKIYNRFDITAYKHSDYTGKLTSYSRIVYP